MGVAKQRKKVAPRIWLKQIREDAAFTQSSLAASCGNVTQTHICDIENGKRSPTPQMAKVIAGVLNFDWTRFYEEEDEKEG